MKPPHRDWAIEKVRQLSPSSKEKGTLLALARYADTNGGHCFPSVRRLAEDTGQSERTIQNHIHALNSRCSLPRIGNEDDGTDDANAELRIKWQGQRYVRTNLYSITICKLASISPQQTKLALSQPIIKSKVIIEDEGPIEISKETEELMKSVTEKLSINNRSFENPDRERIAEQSRKDREAVEMEKMGVVEHTWRDYL